MGHLAACYPRTTRYVVVWAALVLVALMLELTGAWR